MELKRRRFDFRKIVTFCYVVAFVIYLIVGLQPAEARQYTISGNLEIPSIELVSDVTTLELNEHKLDTPDTIVGSYSRNTNKTLLIGHSTTVFANLDDVVAGDTIYYNNNKYTVRKVELFQKTDINMSRLLKSEEQETIVIMTCAGQILDNHDATHRLIVTALKG